MLLTSWPVSIPVSVASSCCLFVACWDTFRRFSCRSSAFQYRIEGKGVDLPIVTGGVSTDGQAASLRAAREFFIASEVRVGTPSRLITRGLDSRGHILLVPGNHDRYGAGFWQLQKPSQVFEEVFGTPRAYPYTVCYPTTRGPTLLFLFLTRRCRTRNRRRIGPGSHVAI